MVNYILVYEAIYRNSSCDAMPLCVVFHHDGACVIHCHVDTVLHKIIMNKTKCVQLGIVDILLKQSYPLV